MIPSPLPGRGIELLWYPNRVTHLDGQRLTGGEQGQRKAYPKPWTATFTGFPIRPWKQQSEPVSFRPWKGGPGRPRTAFAGFCPRPHILFPRWAARPACERSGGALGGGVGPPGSLFGPGAATRSDREGAGPRKRSRRPHRGAGKLGNENGQRSGKILGQFGGQ